MLPASHCKCLKVKYMYKMAECFNVTAAVECLNPTGRKNTKLNATVTKEN